jgi:hypothetical protein
VEGGYGRPPGDRGAIRLTKCGRLAKRPALAEPHDFGVNPAALGGRPPTIGVECTPQIRPDQIRSRNIRQWRVVIGPLRHLAWFSCPPEWAASTFTASIARHFDTEPKLTSTLPDVGASRPQERLQRLLYRPLEEETSGPVTISPSSPRRSTRVRLETPEGRHPRVMVMSGNSRGWVDGWDVGEGRET